jgi:protein-S-isoprenylcysteine O-methyltransferase Ste14
MTDRQAMGLTIRPGRRMLIVMGKTAAATGSILFFFLAPGAVAFALPLLLSQWPVDPLWRDVPAIGWAGAVLGAAGVAALIECFARFALKGLGTPAPIAPTKHLVVSGLYRYVRNPMYVAVLTIILGQALWFASWPVFVYALVVWLCFTTFVLSYEEPTLRRTYGQEYADYCARVGRWLPRLIPWAGPV